MKNLLRKNAREWALLGLLIALVAVMGIISPDKFFNVRTLRTMAFQLPELGILALAMMVVLLTGSANLSSVAVSSISGIGMAMTMTAMIDAGAAVFPAILAGLAVGVAISVAAGLINSFFVAYVGVAAWLVTLSTSTLFEGIGMFITKGAAVRRLPEQYVVLGTATWAGIPVILIIFVAVAVCAAVILERTPWGKRVFMMGCNVVATEYSGINTRKVTVKVYIFSALMSFLAAIMITSRYNSAKVDYGSSYLMQSIAACVLGGVNIAGGHGKVTGVVLAVAIMQVLSSGLNTIGVNRLFIDITTGLVLIAVLAMNYFTGKVKNRLLLGRSAQK